LFRDLRPLFFIPGTRTPEIFLQNFHTFLREVTLLCTQLHSEAADLSEWTQYSCGSTGNRTPVLLP